MTKNHFYLAVMVFAGIVAVTLTFFALVPTFRAFVAGAIMGGIAMHFWKRNKA